MYLRYFDDRFGDVYELYLNDVTGAFEGALRSLEGVGRNAIYYDTLKEIPPMQRNAIENFVRLQQEKIRKE